MAEVITQCDCGQLPPLPRNQQLDAYDRKQWGATLSDTDLDAMRARFVAAELEPIARGCEECGAEAGEECRPMCIGQAAEMDAREADCLECDGHGVIPCGECSMGADECSKCGGTGRRQIA